MNQDIFNISMQIHVFTNTRVLENIVNILLKKGNQYKNETRV